MILQRMKIPYKFPVTNYNRIRHNHSFTSCETPTKFFLTLHIISDDFSEGFDAVSETINRSGSCGRPRALRPKNFKNAKLLFVDKHLNKKSSLKVKRKPKVLATGHTLSSAKDTVDALNRKLRRFTHGFDIPGRVAKRIKERRISQWNEKLGTEPNDENTEPFSIDQIASVETEFVDIGTFENDTYRLIEMPKQKPNKKKKRQHLIQPIRKEKRPKTQKTKINIEELPIVYGSEADDENLTFWKVKSNSPSSLLFQHFEIKSRSQDKSKLYLKCRLCPDDKNLLSCMFGNNSNLRHHLEAVKI